MVGFIDLVLSNPLLLFFVVAMVLNLFGSGGNKKEKEKQRKQAPNSPTRQARQSNKTEEMDWRDIFRQENFPFFEEEQPSKPTKTRQTVESKTVPLEPVRVDAAEVQADEALYQGNTALQEQYERLKAKQKQAKNQVKMINDSPIYSGEIIDSSPNKLDLNFNHVSQDEVVKAIIWSEILNKPKSKSS